MKRLLLTVALLLVVAVASAQVTTSTLRGVVTDNDNKPIAGAAVIAHHEPSGSQRGAYTNADGHYVINGMRVGGPYSIEISYLGYHTEHYTVAEMHVGETLYIDAKLKEDTEYIGEVLVVHTKHDARTENFNELEMAAIPTIDRSIYDLTKLMSSAVNGGAGGIVLAGQSTRYNAFTIDGTSSADIYGLGTTGMTGSLTSANPIPIDAIREVEISH